MRLKCAALTIKIKGLYRYMVVKNILKQNIKGNSFNETNLQHFTRFFNVVFLFIIK